MGGFIRRYSYFPGTEVITLIEGVVIIDLPPPASISGVGSGTLGMVGEFVDMTYATSVDGSGGVTTKAQPIEVFSAQDMLNKVGGFDATLGEFGISGGNAFVALRNKQYSRLVCVPVNLAASKGVRLIRYLPSNKGATDTTPVVPMQAALIPAGTEFKTGANRVRTAGRVTFTDDAAYVSATDGVLVHGGAGAVTQTFTSATGAFIVNGVTVGDIIVLNTGVTPSSSLTASIHGTYRVQAVTDASTLVLERMDGQSFDFTATASVPYRIHVARTADSGVGTYGLVSAYLIPARALDASVVSATPIAPTVTPPTQTATAWDPLDGLQLAPYPTTGVVYVAATMAPNVAASSTLDTLYTTAIDALLSEDEPARDVNILLIARTSSNIRSAQKTHVLNASQNGIGRSTVVWPELTVLTTSAVVAASSPGVGAYRDERVDYCWPGAQTFIPEAVGYRLKNALGTYQTDGLLDVPGDSFLGSILSNLPPERNPGQEAAPVPTLTSGILGLQRGVSGLAIGDYTQLRKSGVVALRKSRRGVFGFQSGVTTSLTAGQKNINRRRMADFIEDSLAQALEPLSKLPVTNQWQDSVVTEIDGFLDSLLSPNNKAAQRINDYLIDDKSGNTEQLSAAGIFVVIVKVKLTPTADFIVLQCEIGEGVQITRTA